MRTFAGNGLVTTNTLLNTIGPSGDFALSVWAKATGAGQSHANVWGLEGIVGDSSGFCGIGRGTITAQYDGWWAFIYDGTEKKKGIAVTLNTLTHLLLQRRSGNLEFYVNGVEAGGTVASGSPSTLTGPVTVGRGWTGASTFFNGDIGRFYGWNDSFTQAEITQLARGAYARNFRFSSLKAGTPIDGVFSPEMDDTVAGRTYAVTQTTFQPVNPLLAMWMRRPLVGPLIEAIHSTGVTVGFSQSTVLPRYKQALITAV